jgi:hypothetical protein
MISRLARSPALGWLILLAGIVVTAAVYFPGLSGGYLFDDFPNIVDNAGVHINDASVKSLARAAVSSPSSDFKRPLSSLSFAANYYATGLNPAAMKVTNLVIHLLNGWLVFIVARQLLLLARRRAPIDEQYRRYAGITAALVATGWLLLPINLTAVLYVVQRMEALANFFVLAGLAGYLHARKKMLLARGGWILLLGSLAFGTAVGAMAKETAVLLPLYAFLAEWIIIGFAEAANERVNRKLLLLYLVLLLVPLVAGLAWLLPSLLRPETWAMRDFGLETRLLSEARIVVSYVVWTLAPSSHALSFYHDDFVISQGWMTPATTMICALLLAAAILAIVVLRKRQPVVAVGMALFLGCHTLTATILPLELIYEHRNYFASFGLLLAVVPVISARIFIVPSVPRTTRLACSGIVGLALLFWATTTFSNAGYWGEPLLLAQELARRGPDSPRAQYELGRQLIIESRYKPDSPYTAQAYAPLERAATLPGSSILPEQALIFMNARMRLPLKDSWWQTLIAKLRARPATVQDDSSLISLMTCQSDKRCDLPTTSMRAAFEAAMSHPKHSSRLAAAYGDYAWNQLNEHDVGLAATEDAVALSPREPAYRITLARMYSVQARPDLARKQVEALQTLNLAGSLDRDIDSVNRQLSTASLSP